MSACKQTALAVCSCPVSEGTHLQHVDVRQETGMVGGRWRLAGGQTGLRCSRATQPLVSPLEPGSAIDP